MAESGDGWAEGVAYVEGLIADLGVPAETRFLGTNNTWASAESTDMSCTEQVTHERWPSPIARLFRIYQGAKRSFISDLYDASGGLYPPEIFAELAWRKQNGDVALQHGRVYLSMANAVAIFTCSDRVRPEMMLALQAELVGRILVDEWTLEGRSQPLWNEHDEERARGHKVFTDMLTEVMETLLPEFERWWPEWVRSLEGVRDTLLQIRDEMYQSVVVAEM